MERPYDREGRIDGHFPVVPSRQNWSTEDPRAEQKYATIHTRFFFVLSL
jgi:hypothetical protein